MDTTTTRDAALVQRLQALGEQTRLRIVRLLASGERCVCELQDTMDVAQPRLSFHLRKLREAGLVTHRREGRWIHYALDHDALDQLRDLLDDVGSTDAWDRPPGTVCCD